MGETAPAGAAVEGACEQCGGPYRAGEVFCGNCGAFLGWVRAGAGGPEPDAGTGPPAPRGERVTAVLPDRPEAARPYVRPGAGDGPPAADGPPCPACGTPNAADRSFCRQCGRRLAAGSPAVAAPVSWWRRLARRLRAVSPRPLVRLAARLAAIAFAVLLVIAAGFGAVRFGGPAIETVRDRLAKPEPAYPAQVTASSAAPAHPARLAVDGRSNRFWAPARTGPASGQYLDLTFARPFRLLDMIIHAGSSPRRDVFLATARPADLTLLIATGHGPVRRTVHLEDRPGPQRVNLAVGDVRGVRLTITAAYGARRDRRVALAEVEFFRRP